jgi:CDP-glucose 4,6-dehydratase
MGARVSGISLKPHDERGNLYKIFKLKNSMKSYYVDLRNINKLSNTIKKVNPDMIFHLAAQPYVLKSYENPIETISSNIIGLANLLEACRGLKKLKAILNVTTDKCYENLEQNIPFKENDRLGGKDIYSASKACSEIISKSYFQSFFEDLNINLSTARAGNIIGGGDFGENRIVPDLIESVEKNKFLYVRSPNSVRPWQHVFDVLNGYMILMKRSFTRKSSFESFNFSPKTRQVVKVKNVVGLLSLQLDYKKIKYKQIKTKKESIILRLNPTSAKKILKWECKYNINECIKKTASWYSAYLRKEDMILYSKKEINNFFNLT